MKASRAQDFKTMAVLIRTARPSSISVPEQTAPEVTVGMWYKLVL